MKKNNSILKNYFYNLSYQILVILIPIVTTPYLSRVLGADNIGIYSYTLSITTYFILFGSLGVALYGQKEIAYNQDDSHSRSVKFFEIFLMRAITLIIATISFYFLFMKEGKYSEYYSILFFELLANMFDISWFFQGMEEFKKIVIRNILIKAISLILIFTLVKTQNDLKIYFVIYILTNVINSIALWPYVFKFVEKVKWSELKIFSNLKPCLILFIPQVATQIYTVLDKTMLGLMVENISEVAYYEQVQKITKVSLSIITSLGIVMLPRMSNLFAKKDMDKIKISLTNSFNFVIMLALPLMFGLIAISNSLIPWFLGEKFSSASIIMKSISPIILFIALTNVIGIQYLLPTKKEKPYTFAVLAGAITNLIFNFILIGTFKSVGAAIATDIAEFSVLIVMIYCTRKEFNYISIFKRSIKYFLTGILILISGILIEKIISPSFECMILQIIIGVIIYLLMLFITKDKLFFKFIKKMKFNRR